jgi:ADP-ribosylglycohydrolase
VVPDLPPAAGPEPDEAVQDRSRSLPPERVAELHSRARGCLLAGALGDALGAPIEFMTLTMIRGWFGYAGLQRLEPAYGRLGAITDDTQMTLFTAEGLVRASVRGKSRGIGDPASVVHHAYLRWLHTQGVPWPQAAGALLSEQRAEPDGWLVGERFLHARRAPGSTCLAALEHARLGEAARNDSKGCGTVMRIAPVGLLSQPGPGGGTTAREGIFRLAVEIAALTHGHPTGQLAAGVQAATIHSLAYEGRPLGPALALALELLRDRPRHEETLAALDAARDLAARGEPSPEKLQTLGGGWVAEEALAIAVYAALSHPQDLRAALVLAANHSGDSDSTASICGHLLGAALGEAALPGEWLSVLEGRDVIRQLADDLIDETCDLRPAEDGGAGYTRWFRRYPGG